MGDQVVVGAHPGTRVYGPYTPERGQEVADELNKGSWQNEYWLIMPIEYLPGEPRPIDPPTELDIEQIKRELFEELERRQFGGTHGDQR